MLSTPKLPPASACLQTIETRYASHAQLDARQTLLRPRPTALAEFGQLRARFPPGLQISSRERSTVVSERLVNGWHGISYVRKMSVERLKAAPEEPPAPLPTNAKVKSSHGPQGSYAKIQRRSLEQPDPAHVDLRKPWTNLVDCLETPAPKAPAIYDRGQSFLEQREEKINALKRPPVHAPTKPRPPDSASKLQPGGSWRNFSSLDDGRRARAQELAAKKQRKLQEQYERHIADKVEALPKREPKPPQQVREGTIADRNEEWVRRREERLEEIRRGKAESELGPCTFKPKINRGFISWN